MPTTTHQLPKPTNQQPENQDQPKKTLQTNPKTPQQHVPSLQSCTGIALYEVVLGIESPEGLAITALCCEGV